VNAMPRCAALALPASIALSALLRVIVLDMKGTPPDLLPPPWWHADHLAGRRSDTSNEWFFCQR
jgi:hypothetical protein